MADRNIIARGIGASGYSIAMTSLVSASVYLWLVSKLTPSELGIVTTGYSVYLMLYLFKDFGLTPAIVSQRDATHEFLVSAYTLRICIVLLLASAGLVISAVLPEILDAQEIRWIVILVVFSLFAEALGFLSAAMLQRDLAFVALARVDVATACVAGGTTVVIALYGYPVLALFAGLALSSLLRSLLLIRLRPVRGRLSLKMLRGYGLLAFGSQLFIIKGVSYAVLNLNVFVLASVDLRTLGFYGLAAQWATKPSDMFSFVVNRVMLPAYSAVVRSGKDVFRSYLTTTRYLSILALGVFCVLIGFGPLFVNSAYGPEWRGSVPILEALLVFGLIRTLAEPAGSLLVSVQRPGLYMWAQILGLAVMAVLVYPVAQEFGAFGCSILLTSVFVLHLCALWILVPRLFGSNSLAVLSEVARPTLSAIVAVLVAGSTYLLVHGDWVFLVLTVQVPIVYILSLRLLAYDDLRSAMSLARQAVLAGR